MPIDPWLPVAYKLPDGASVRHAVDEGVSWQLFSTDGDGRVLVVKEPLAARWLAAGLVGPRTLSAFRFGSEEFLELSSGPRQLLIAVRSTRSPQTKSEALAFADAIRATREIDNRSPLHDAIYVEKLSRLLPTYSISAPIPDDVVLGTWLSGGVNVSTNASRRLLSLVGWLGEQNLAEVLDRAGSSLNRQEGTTTSLRDPRSAETTQRSTERFTLPGRPKLEAFFNEFVIDIVSHPERYKPLGIDFPAPIILQGPPGCGKTYAVERLVDFLGWPSFAIDASSVASPYIHETSRKVAEVFEAATKHAPAVLVIDEMEAFLADRELGAASSHHRVEEVAEFLRRIPDAMHHDVLVVAMTNRIDMIDPAVLRRGRFDHVVRVDMASEDEARALLHSLIEDLPHEASIDINALASRLSRRPLSDVAFVVREGARLAARAGKVSIDSASLGQGLESMLSSQDAEKPTRKLGFQ